MAEDKNQEIMDRENIEFLIQSHRDQMDEFRTQKGEEIEKELAEIKKNLVGTREMREEALEREGARLRTEGEAWLNEQNQVLQAEMFQEYGGNIENG